MVRTPNVREVKLLAQVSQQMLVGLTLEPMVLTIPWPQYVIPLLVLVRIRKTLARGCQKHHVWQESEQKQENSTLP
jgi:hypothetical protein